MIKNALVKSIATHNSHTTIQLNTLGGSENFQREYFINKNYS